MAKKIVAFSDLHGQISKNLTKWFNDNPGDILLFAGDLQLNGYDDGSNFLAWMNTLPYKHKIMIFGNHDGNYEYTLEEVAKYKNMKFLMNESIEVEGIKIFGSPNTLPFLDWYHMKTEEELAKIYAKIPDDTDILITHTPMFRLLDLTNDGMSAGSKNLYYQFIRLENIAYHICGHIHESFGKVYIDNRFTINCSILNERYEYVNKPVVIDYK